MSSDHLYPRNDKMDLGKELRYNNNIKKAKNVHAYRSIFN